MAFAQCVLFDDFVLLHTHTRTHTHTCILTTRNRKHTPGEFGFRSPNISSALTIDMRIRSYTNSYHAWNRIRLMNLYILNQTVERINGRLKFPVIGRHCCSHFFINSSRCTRKRIMSHEVWTTLSKQMFAKCNVPTIVRNCKCEV